MFQQLQIQLHEFPKLKAFLSVQRMNKIWRSYDLSDILLNILDLSKLQNIFPVL
jgi:hypothetical protein